MNLTAERLREVLDYNPNTGQFAWRINLGNRVCIGKPVGTVHRQGYVRIRVDGKKYPAHRLAWLHVHGVWPAHELDHIDRDPGNNRLANLRQATDEENCSNRKLYVTNRSGHRGVRFRPDAGKWFARIGHNRVQYSLGSFDTKEAAIAARLEAEKRLFGEFAPVDKAA